MHELNFQKSSIQLYFLISVKLLPKQNKAHRSVHCDSSESGSRRKKGGWKWKQWKNESRKNSSYSRSDPLNWINVFIYPIILILHHCEALQTATRTPTREKIWRKVILYIRKKEKLWVGSCVQSFSCMMSFEQMWTWAQGYVWEGNYRGSRNKKIKIDINWILVTINKCYN